MKESVSNGQEKRLTAAEYRKMLKRGRYCVKHDLDNEAFRLLTEVYEKFSNPQTDEEKNLFIEAAEGIFELHKTDNEYIYERTSWYVHDYLDWCEAGE